MFSEKDRKSDKPSQDLLCTHDLQGNLLWINSAPAQVLGYSVEELLRIPMRQLLAPEMQNAFDEYLTRVQQDGVATGLLAVQTRAGEPRCWEYLNTLSVVASYAPVVHGIAQDITDRRKAGVARYDAGELNRELINGAKEIIFVLDRELRFVAWNRHAEIQLGISASYVLGKLLTEVFPDLPAYDRNALEGALQGDPAHSFEVPVSFPGREPVYLLGRVAPLRSQVEVRGVIVTAQDVSPDRRGEDALHLSQERLRIALKNSSVMAFHQDQDLRYTWMEHPILAWAEQEYVGKTDAEIIGADGSTLLETLKRGVLDTGNALCQEVCIAINGADRYFDLTVELMRNSDGTSSGINGAFVDVTERKKDNRRLRELSAKLCEDTLDLESEVRIQPALQGILGDSAALQGVLAQATIVAQSDSTVLLLGETGTGKELVARAIHRMSRRCENSFIKLNCAAIPTGLLESELFGYERGAFTHAVTQKVGRLELADKGTFFLDEVGEIPLEQQPKLLRVLQDREFERLGSVRTTKVDIRLIAATNRNLAQSVESREFRRDLFYRLNVFPIVLPPLRERREDIPILVHHLVRRYAAHMNKKIETIPSVALRAMIQAEWPGNIRQLENFVERAVILTQGTTLRISLSDLHAEASNSPETIDRIQRSYLLRVLRECGGIIAGPNGAAAKLGLKRTTLSSKMLRLGISRRDYQLDPPEPGLRNPSNPAA